MTRIEVANSAEALAYLASDTVDLALLDFNMPGRDGLSLATEMRALNPHMPLAIVAANMRDEIVAQASAIGATFLAKPLTQPALAAFLSAVETQLRPASG